MIKSQNNDAVGAAEASLLPPPLGALRLGPDQADALGAVGMFRMMLVALSCGFGVISSLAQAAAPNGTWKFERSADYDGRAPLGLVSRFDTRIGRAGKEKVDCDLD